MATQTGYRMAVVGGKSDPVHALVGVDIRAGLRHRRRRAQLPPVYRGLEWPDAELSWFDRQLLQQPAGRSGFTSYTSAATDVYQAPTRGYNFDTDFLLPSLLPPGTPMFRDVNTLTFRQLLRPTQ